MDLQRTLMQIERELTIDSGPGYRRHLADDAVVIVPGAILDKDATIAAMAQSPGWSGFDAEDVRLVELGDGVALITYTFHAHRAPDTNYSAVLTSVYSREGDEWRLRLHQQTPVNRAGSGAGG
jgi:ketosteroid isomerase-like protein